jgi:hypothetical protein
MVTHYTAERVHPEAKALNESFDFNINFVMFIL